MTNDFHFFIIFFLVFFNQLSKFLFFCQTILFYTSNECFSHFNVQQLSTLKHKSFCFVFTSSFKNNIENENIRKKSISFDFIEFRILRSEFFFSKKKKAGGGGRLFGTLEYDENHKVELRGAFETVRYLCWSFVVKIVNGEKASLNMFYRNLNMPLEKLVEEIVEGVKLTVTAKAKVVMG